MNRRVELSVELAKQCRTAASVAQEAGVHKNTFSGIVSGRINPTVEERVRIANALGKKVEDLFADN